MNSQTMPLIRGKRYQFRVFPKGPHLFSELSKNTVTLTYLRDEMGACRSTGERTIFHIFRWSAGALESFTDEQLKDYEVKKIRTHPRSGKARPQSF